MASPVRKQHPEKPTAEAATPAAGKHAANVHNAASTITPDPLQAVLEAPPAFRLKMTRMSDVPRRWPKFLYPQRVPASALTMLGGDPGLGKSTWTNYLAGRVTRGELGPAGPVMFALGEDGIDGVLNGRLEAAGADMDRILVFEGEGEGPFSLPESVPALAADVKMAGARLVILDPLDNFWTPGTNTGKASSLRAALTPLANMAQELGVAVIVVTHLNKDRGGSALHRFSGSLGGLAGVMRSALLFGLDPEDPDDEEGRRALGHIKSNWGTTAQTEIFQHRGVELPDIDGNTFSVSRLEYLGDSETTGEELVANPDDETPAGKLERATELLAETLADGNWHKKGEVIQLGNARGVKPRTLERAAKKEGIESKQEGKPAVAYWRFATLAEPVGEATLANLPKPHGQAEFVQPIRKVRQAPGDGEPPEKGMKPTVAGTDPDPFQAAWAEAVKTVGAEFERLPEPVRDRAEPDPEALAELEAAANLAADAGNESLALSKIREWQAVHLDCIRQAAATDDHDRIGEAA